MNNILRPNKYGLRGDSDNPLQDKPLQIQPLSLAVRPLTLKIISSKSLK